MLNIFPKYSLVYNFGFTKFAKLNINSQIHKVRFSQSQIFTKSQIYFVTYSHCHRFTSSQIHELTSSKIHIVTDSYRHRFTSWQIHIVISSPNRWFTNCLFKKAQVLPPNLGTFFLDIFLLFSLNCLACSIEFLRNR